MVKGIRKSEMVRWRRGNPGLSTIQMEAGQNGNICPIQFAGSSYAKMVLRARQFEFSTVVYVVSQGKW